jgi:hypothetical protein
MERSLYLVTASEFTKRLQMLAQRPGCFGIRQL